MTDVVDLVSELVRIPSVSPFGKMNGNAANAFGLAKKL